ncbi:sensor histidine kinase [Ferruginibacter yonginensis]|uniref:Sensor histidine kinase n=1 Tax=Ferruginibacter yonginensis TaxID=1310416 RepID=A0ABV8QRC4_9BACT
MSIKLNKAKSTLLLIIPLFIASISSAQLQPSFIQFLTDKGLQSNTIYNLHVAKNGLLYIAHSKGLSSFDGNHFTNYYNKEHPFTELTNIMETDDGSIFCKAFNNVLFKKQGDSTRWYANTIPYSWGFSISTTYKNNLFAITNDSIIEIDVTTNKRKSICLKNAELLNKNIAISFIGYSTNFNFYILSSEKKLYLLPRVLKGGFHYSNKDLFIVKNKQLDAIYYYNNSEYIQIKNAPEPITVNYISTTDSTIWICTSNGIYYRKKNNKGGNFTYIFSGYDVTDVKQTKEGSYFISTLGQGLLFVPNLKANSIINIPHNITAMSGNETELLLGTKDGSILHYNTLTNNINAVETYKSKFPINFIGINQYNQSPFFSNITSIINKTNQPFIIKDYCYVDSNILFATSQGVFLYQSKIDENHWLNKYVITYQLNNSNIKKLSFSNEHTSSIKYNPFNKTIYISNYTGILEMKNGYTQAIKLPEPACVLKDIIVWNDALLLATKDKGILQWTGQSYIPAFTNKPTTGILYKFFNYKNELWVLGEDAIFCYNNNQLYKYDKQMGINTDNTQNFFVTENKVYLNNGNNIIAFSKNLLNTTNVVPTFILNKVTYGNNKNSLPNNSTIGFENNSINFQFSLIAYANATNTHVAYSINGKELVHLPSDRREINLAFLKADNYKIDFFIVTNGIVSNTVSQSFTFKINAPFYNTWWFISIISCIIMGIVYALVKLKIKKERSQLALKESKILLEKELDKTTLSGIKAQMNPHFIFNALNTIQSYVYMNDKKNAGIYISKFSDLTRSILDMSNKDAITISEEINALSLYLSLEKMRFEDSFEYEILVDDTLEVDKITIPAMLIQPYVENAVKHGLLHRKTNRQLQIRFQLEGEQVKILVDDNGIGRKRSAELKELNKKLHQSFSMNANKKRLDILQQHFKEVNLQIVDKYDNDGQATGTLVIIKLPINT